MKRARILMACALLMMLAVIPAQGQDDSAATPEAVETTAAPTEVVTEIATDVPVETAAPTEAATEIPTEVVTEAATEAPTEIVTEAPAATEEIPATATDIPAEIPTEAAPPVETVPGVPVIIPAEPAMRLFIREMFEDGNLSAWNLGAGWSLVSHADNQMLQVSDSNAPAILARGDFLNVAVQAQVYLQAGAAQLTVRGSETGNYTATLDATGLVRLFRSSEILQTAQIIPNPESNTLRLSAVDGIVRVAVNDVEVIALADAAPLPAGKIAISADFTLSSDGSPLPMNTLLVNDVFVWVKESEWDSYATATPTAEPVIVATEAPTEIATEAAPVEPTAEATQEAAVIATEEATEIATEEATVAPTDEAPAEPVVDENGKEISRALPPTDEQLRVAHVMSNDIFADAFEIPYASPLVPYVISDDTTAATREDGEPVPNCDLNIANTVWFKITPAATTTYIISTAGSTFDTVIGVYKGTSLATLTKEACNDDAATTTFSSQVTVTLLPTTYYIQVGGFNGRFGNYALRVTQSGLAIPALAPVLTAPVDNFATNNLTTLLPALNWNPVANAHHYEIQIDDSNLFTSLNQTNTNLGAPPYTVTPLLPGTTGTTYYWRVRGLNINSQPGPWSVARRFVVDTLAQPDVTLTLPAAGAVVPAVRPTFTWVAVAGATSYRLDIDTDPDKDGICDFTPGDSVIENLTVVPATYTIPAANPALPQGWYCYQVRPVDAAVNVNLTGTRRAFSVFIGTAPLSNAVVFTAGVLTTVNVNFTWAAVTGSTGYTLNLFNEDCTTPAPGFVAASQTTMVKAVMLGYGKYCWTVQAAPLDAALPAIFRKFTVSPLAPAAPLLTSLTTPAQPAVNLFTSDTTPDFVWAATAATAGGPFTYDLQVDNNGCTFPSPEINQTLLATPNFMPGAPMAEGLYCWRVRTVNTFGVAGAYSTTRSFTVDITPQPNGALTLPAAGAVVPAVRPTFSWVAVAGATSYRLDVDTDPDKDGTCDFATGDSVIENLTVVPVAYTIPVAQPALPQGWYCYQVRAVDAAGNINTGTRRAFSVFIGTAPLNNAVVFTAGTLPTVSVSFTWGAVTGSTGYTLNLFNDDCVTPATGFIAASQTTLVKAVPLPYGKYCWTVQASPLDAAVPTTVRKFTVSPAAPVAPLLTSLTTPAQPAVNLFTMDTTPDFVWAATATTLGAPFTYDLQVDNSGCAFPSPEINQTLLATPNFTTLTPLNDGLYCWRVRTVNTFGVAGAYSTTRSFTVDTTPQAAPALTLPAPAAVVSTARPTFTWVAVPGATSYRLDVDDDPDMDGTCDFTPAGNLINDRIIATVSYVIPVAQPALPQGWYCWQVRAVDAAGNVGNNTQRAFSIFIGTAPLANANVFTTGVLTSANVTFTWAAITGATGYTLTVYADDCTTPISGAANLTVMSKLLTLPIAKYCWKVQALGIDAATPSTFRRVTVSTPAPLAPVLSQPALNASTSDNTPTFTWAASTSAGAMTYDLQVDNSGCAFPSPEINQTGLSATTFTPGASLADGLYCWRVRSVNFLSVPGAYSVTRSFTVDVLPTTTPNLTAPLDNSSTMVVTPSFTWTAVATAAKYEIQLKTLETPCNNADVPLITVTTPAYVPPAALLNRTYYWCVRALDAAGNPSPWSVRRAVKIFSAPTAVPVLNRFAFSPLKLTWGAITWASYYQIQIDNNATFLSPEFQSSNLVDVRSVEIPILAPLTTGSWYWRVRACPVTGACGAWSTSGLFTIDL